MSIIAFEITNVKNIPIQTKALSLDELTREIPDGFYTTFSTNSQAERVLGLHMHLQRLYDPAHAQGINPSVNESILRIRISELAKINLPNESRIRLILSKSNGMIYVGVQSFAPLPKAIYSKGVKVLTAKLSRRAPRVKDTGFISSSVEQRSLLSKDIFEILLTKDKRILEGMTSNFYAIKGKTLITAQRGILLGVTRRIILRVAREQGMSIDYRAPLLNEKFDEAFLTSSSRGVVPIISIDNQSIGQGRVGGWTKILSKAYQAYVKERSEAILIG